MPEEPHRQGHLPASGGVTLQHSPSTAAVCGSRGKALSRTTTRQASGIVVVCRTQRRQHGGGQVHATDQGPSAVMDLQEPDEAELYYRLGLKAAAEMDAATFRAEVDKFHGPEEQRPRRQVKEASFSFFYQLSDEEAWADVKKVYDMVRVYGGGGKRRRR